MWGNIYIPIHPVMSKAWHNPKAFSTCFLPHTLTCKWRGSGKFYPTPCFYSLNPQEASAILYHHYRSLFIAQMSSASMENNKLLMMPALGILAEVIGPFPGPSGLCLQIVYQDADSALTRGSLPGTLKRIYHRLECIMLPDIYLMSRYVYLLSFSCPWILCKWHEWSKVG